MQNVVSEKKNFEEKLIKVVLPRDANLKKNPYRRPINGLHGRGYFFLIIRFFLNFGLVDILFVKHISIT